MSADELIAALLLAAISASLIYLTLRRPARRPAAMIELDIRRHARALERVRLAIRAAGLKGTAKGDALEGDFNAGWTARAGRIAAQEAWRDVVCNRAATMGAPIPPPPPSPTRRPLAA